MLDTGACDGCVAFRKVSRKECCDQLMARSVGFVALAFSYGMLEDVIDRGVPVIWRKQIAEGLGSGRQAAISVRDPWDR